MAASKPSKSLASFGETPLLSLQGRTVRGSERQLTLSELTRTGPDGNLRPTGVTFRFAREDFSAPRGPQQFGLQLRTFRADLPGAEEPVEQVLGWNYKDFTVKGVWDDRHAGAGYAEQTRRAFEELVKRGNPVRYQFEQISMTGLIKDVDLLYVRKDYQTYSFTISPHNRFEGETVRVDPNKNNKIHTDPKTAVKKAREGLDQIQQAQDLARARNASRVQQLLNSSIFSDIDDAIETVNTSVGTAEHLVEKEILGPTENVQKALNRGAQTMASAKTAAATILSKQKAIQADANLSIALFVEQLKFENWHRTLAGSARAFVVQSEQSRKDFALRVTPKTKRLHRVRLGESLYQISLHYYGTPHHWREILSHNHLGSLILYGGELLEIPEIRA